MKSFIGEIVFKQMTRQPNKNFRLVGLFESVEQTTVALNGSFQTLTHKDKELVDKMYVYEIGLHCYRTTRGTVSKSGEYEELPPEL